MDKKGVTSVVWIWFEYEKSDTEEKTVLCEICHCPVFRIELRPCLGGFQLFCLSWSYNPLITPDACALCLRSGARGELISFNCSQCVLTPPVCAVYLRFVTTPVIHSSLQRIQSSNSAQSRSRRRGIRAQTQNKVSGSFSK